MHFSMMYSLWRCLAMTAVICCLLLNPGAGSVLAETGQGETQGEEQAEVQPAEVPARDRVGLNFEFKSDYMAGAQVSGEPGSFSFYQVGASAAWRWFDLSWKQRTYSWRKTDRLPFGHGVETPFKDFTTLAFELRHMGRFRNNWRYMLSGGVSDSFEKEMGPLAAKGAGFVIVPLGEKLRVQLGGSVFYHPVRSYFFPMLGFVYSGQENGSGSGFLVSVGVPRTTVGYRINSSFDVWWSLEVDSTVYRLAESSKVESRGYVEPRDFKNGLYLKYTASKYFVVTAGGGYAFGRNLIFYDSDGEKTGEYEVSNAPFARIKLELKF